MKILLIAILLTSVGLARTYTGREDCGSANAWPHYRTHYLLGATCKMTLELTQTAAQGNQSWGNVVYSVEANGTYRGTYHQTGNQVLIDFPGKTYLYFRAFDVYRQADGTLYGLTDMRSEYRTKLAETAGGGNGGGGGNGNGDIDMYRLNFDATQILIRNSELHLGIQLEHPAYGSLSPAVQKMRIPAESFRDCVFEDKLAIRTCIPMFKKYLAEWEAFVPEFYAVHGQHGLEKAKRRFSGLAEITEKVRTQLKAYLN